MENLFVLKQKKEKGSPVSLSEGILHSELNKENPFEPLKTDSGEWRTCINTIAKLPKELWFITRDKYYNFDLHYDSGGFFVSDELLNYFNTKKTTNFVYTKLHILNKTFETVSVKNYNYLKFYSFNDIIDYEKSKIDFDKKGVLKKIWKLEIIENLENDLFLIYKWLLIDKIFCTESIKDEMKKNKFIGIEFIPIKDARIMYDKNYKME